MAEWTSKVERASNKLFELTELITYKRLKGEDGWPLVKLSGDTAARVHPALEEMGDLWEHDALVRRVVVRARELHENILRLLPSRRSLDEIQHLLEGPSIKLPSIATPLAERGLLRAGEVADSVTPERLMEAMTRSYEVARDAVAAVDAAWDRLMSLLDGYDREVAALEQLASSLGEPAPNELPDVRGQIILAPHPDPN